MKIADTTGALSLEAIRGEQAAFDPRIHAVRKQPGQIAAAANVRRITRRQPPHHGSGARGAPGRRHSASHAYCARVQDQYSFRCMPQVHGSCRDQLST